MAIVKITAKVGFQFPEDRYSPTNIEGKCILQIGDWGWFSTPIAIRIPDGSRTSFIVKPETDSCVVTIPAARSIDNIHVGKAIEYDNNSDTFINDLG